MRGPSTKISDVDVTIGPVEAKVEHPDFIKIDERVEIRDLKRRMDNLETDVHVLQVKIAMLERPLWQKIKDWWNDVVSDWRTR